MTCTTVVQVLRVLLQLLVVAAIILSFIACFILLVIAPLAAHLQYLSSSGGGKLTERSRY